MKSFYERLLPNIKEVLEEEKDKFPYAIGRVVEDLQKAFVSDDIKYTTFETLRSLCTITYKLRHLNPFSIYCFLVK